MSAAFHALRAMPSNKAIYTSFAVSGAVTTVIFAGLEAKSVKSYPGTYTREWAKATKSYFTFQGLNPITTGK